MLEFSEVESGIFEAPRPGEGILFIQNAVGARARAARPPSRSPANGRSSAAPAGAICALTLTNTAAGEEFAVRVQPRLRSGGHALRAGDLADGPRRDRAARRRTARPGASRRARTRHWRRIPADRRSACCWCGNSRVLVSGARKARAHARRPRRLYRRRAGRRRHRASGVPRRRADHRRALRPQGRSGEARPVLVRGGRRAHQPLLAALPQPRRPRAPHALLQGDRGRRPMASSAARPIRCRA